MPTQRDVNIRIAVQDAQKALEELKRLGVGGENAVRQIITAYGDVPAAAARAGAAVESFSGRLKGSLGNTAAQLQDITVQIQAGTNASVVLAQQLPQLTAGFGPLGAGIGLVASITAVAAGALFGMGREADAAKTASEALDAAAQSLDKTIAGSASSVEDLARKYSVLTGEMRQLERLSLEKSIRDANKAIDEQTKALEGSIRTLADPQQLELLRRQATVGQQLNPQYQPPAAATARLEFLEAASAAARDALASGDFVGLARQVDQLAKSSAAAEQSFREFAEGLIEPAGKVLKARDAIKQAETALDSLAGKKPQGEDPFLDRAKAAEQAEKATERATKASERAAAQSDRRQQALAIEIANMQRLVAAGEESAATYEAMRIQIEGENKARAAGLDPKGAEARLLAELTARLDEQSEARKRNAQAMAEQARAAEQFYGQIGNSVGQMLDDEAAHKAQEAKRAQQELEREQQRELESFRNNLVTATARGLDQGFRQGFGDVDQLIEQFGGLLSSTVATALADNLISESLAGSIKAGLDAKLGDLMPSLAGTGAENTTVGGAVAGALGSAALGYSIGRTTGDRRLGALGGVAGGAATGFAVGGPYGAAAGALIGGVAGFIGGGATGGERNNNFQGGFDARTGRPVEFQNTKPDQANVGNVNAVLAELGTLREGLRGFGVTLGEAELTIQSGNRSGLTLNGESFGSLGGLTEAALDRLLATADLTREQRRVAANSNATTAQGLLADLGFIDQFKQLTGQLSALDVQAKALEASFGTARLKAEELAYSQAQIARLNAAEAEARRELSQRAGRDRANILDFTAAYVGDDAAALRIAIRNQAAEFDQMRDRLRELGASAAQLAQLDKDEAAARAHLIRTTREQVKAEAEATRQAERQRLEATRDGLLREMERQANIVRAGFQERADVLAGRRQDIASALDPLTALREQIQTSDLGGRGTAQRLRATETLFDRAADAARSGGTTPEEAQRLAQLGEQFIGLGRQAYGSGSQAHDIVRNVMDVLGERTGALKAEDRMLTLGERQLAATERGFERLLPEALRAANRDTVEITAKGFAETVRELKELRLEIDRLSSDMTALAQRRWV